MMTHCVRALTYIHPLGQYFCGKITSTFQISGEGQQKQKKLSFKKNEVTRYLKTCGRGECTEKLGGKAATTENIL